MSKNSIPEEALSKAAGGADAAQGAKKTKDSIPEEALSKAAGGANEDQRRPNHPPKDGKKPLHRRGPKAPEKNA